MPEVPVHSQLGNVWPKDGTVKRCLVGPKGMRTAALSNDICLS
jgi:hypothetical protein